MTGLLTLSSKNQITLPANLARELNLKKGTKFWVKTEGKTIKLEKQEDTWDDLQGSLKDTSKTKGKTVLQIIELAKKEEAKRLKVKYEKMLR